MNSSSSISQSLDDVKGKVTLQGIHNSGLNADGYYTFTERGVDYLVEPNEKYDDYRTMEELLRYKTPWVKSVENHVRGNLMVTDDEIFRNLDGLKERSFKGEPDVPFVNGDLTYVGKVTDLKFLEDLPPVIEEEDDE